MKYKIEPLPCFRRGLLSLPGEELDRILVSLWTIVVLIQNILEDVDGLDEREGYLLSLKIKLLEELYTVEEILSIRKKVARTHRLALAAEYGIENVLKVSNVSLVDFIFGEQCCEKDIALEQQRVAEFLRTVITEMPGEISSTVSSGGQRFILNTLRSWSQLAAKLDKDLSSIGHLLRDR